jgi:carboxymethylenebutenolidase
MKNLSLFLFLLCGQLQAQNLSCCMMPSVNHQNNLLAMNESFANAHLVPEPFKLANEKGTSITFKTPDGKEGRAYLVKSSKPTDKVLFVFHEWWGLNDYIKQEAEKLQGELGDVSVYALDLYDGQIAATVPDAQKLMGEMKEERSKAIIKGAINLVGKKAQIASIGWCMGGAWSLQSALLEGKQAVACVIYYGMPEADVAKLRTLHCSVLGIFALKDGFITPEIVKTFEANMKSLKKDITVYNYDSYHAFANPSNPRHNKEYAEDAHAKSLAYLRQKLFGK